MLKRAEIIKRPSTKSAALNIRMTSVLGSTNHHIKAQNAAISDKRKTNIRALINIHILYPILTRFVKLKYPTLPRWSILSNVRQKMTKDDR